MALVAAEATAMEAAVTATVATVTVAAAIATTVAEASRKALEAAAPLLKCLLQGHPLVQIIRTLMRMLIKVGPPMKTQVQMLARSLWSPTSLLKHRLKQLRCLFVSHKMSL